MEQKNGNVRVGSANSDIRAIMASRGIRSGQVAHSLGVSEVEFLCMMRKELSDDVKAGVLAVIEEIPEASLECKNAKEEVGSALNNAREVLAEVDDIREAALVYDFDQVERISTEIESIIRKIIDTLAKLNDGKIAFGEYLEISQKICPMSIAAGQKRPCRKDCAWFAEQTGCFAEHAMRYMENASP